MNTMFFSLDGINRFLELKDRFDLQKDQSLSIFFLDRKDRKIEDRKIEDRIPNPALGRKDIICFCCVCSKLIMCL